MTESPRGSKSPASKSPAPPPPAPDAGASPNRSPRRVVQFGEEHVDGFPTDAPEWVAYCSRCGSKLSPGQHEACEHCVGSVTDVTGAVTAILCDRVEGA